MHHPEFTNPMQLTEKLRVWGSAHAAARAAERAAAQQATSTDHDLRREAQLLRERANRLHREIYSEIGRRREHHG
jgi:hypothetical protein